VRGTGRRVQGIAAVVLAAGASARLGQAKQLIRVGSESLLRRTVRLAAEARCAPVFVVLGYEAERMRAELEGLSAAAVINERWAEGMGSSLRCGIEALGAMEAQSAGVLLMVCDQPEITAEHLLKLVAEQGGDETRIAASGYAGRAGVPAVFGRGFYPELLTVQGDRGAREVIVRHADQVGMVAWPEGELDVDRPGDLEKLRGS
jgi:molybdenum cofactor cytidylyltransferase